MTILEHLQKIHQIFVTFEEWTVTFTFIYQLFQIHLPTDSQSHSLSHLNIIFFIHYLFFFQQLHIFQHFFIQHIIIIIEKMYLKNER